MALDQDKVDQYIKAMSLTGSEKENTEKLAAMWMYAAQMGLQPPSTVRKMTPPSARPIMLIPASSNGSTMAPPPQMMPPMMPYRGVSLPYMRHPSGSIIYAQPGSMPGTFRTNKSCKSSIVNGGPQQLQQQQQQQRRQRRRAGPTGGPRAAGKMDPNRRQRRKSEADVLDGGQMAQAFQYHGLDRAIADNFLARQEQSQGSSHFDYSSSSSAASDKNYGKAISRASSKTKIVCRDVVM